MSYVNKVQQEIAKYKEYDNIHDLPLAFHYWSDTYLRPKLESLGFSGPTDFFLQYIEQVATRPTVSKCEILSVGSGNCDTEVSLAESLVKRNINNFTFTCLDINPHMLERGKQLASEHQLLSRFSFIETDINSWNVNKQYQIIIANQSLHHFVELEILFYKISRSLHETGFFLTCDTIGRNGHMRWPEALEIVHGLWSLLEDRHKWNSQLQRFESVYENWDCSTEGFEGARAQDILPLLIKHFKFHLFIGYSNLINIFVDRAFGHNFDVNNPRDCSFIDFVAKLDDYYIEQGKIKPTQMIASLTKSEVTPVRLYKHLTPEFCVRLPDEAGEKQHSSETTQPGDETPGMNFLPVSLDLLGLPIFYEDFNPSVKTQFDFELDEIIKAHAIEKGVIKGVCNISAVETDFNVLSDNLREDIIANVSHSINRHRQIICALSTAIFGCPYASLAEIAMHINQRRLKVYSAEANSPLFHFLRENLDSDLFVYSEYFGDGFRSGEIVNDMLHEDLQETSFDDESFDIILTSEVFEHIPDAITAEKEVVRILKPGGIYCFTVPFFPESEHDIVLADIDEQGNQRYFAEPQYHGDPIRPDEGILVYRLFSFRDLKERFEELGCDFKTYRFWSKSLGILDSNGWVKLVSKTGVDQVNHVQQIRDNALQVTQEKLVKLRIQLATTEEQVEQQAAALSEMTAQLEQQAISLSEAQSQIADQQASISELQSLVHNREQMLLQLQTSRRWRMTSTLLRLQQWRSQLEQADLKLRRKLHLPGQGVFRGAIDSPQNGEYIDGSMAVRGWVFSTAGAITQVEIYLDDFYVGRVNYGVPRPDVAALYASAAVASCGFDEQFSLDSALVGQKRLLIRAEDEQGHSHFFSRLVWIN